MQALYHALQLGVRQTSSAALAIVVVLASACAHPLRPTIRATDLRAKVDELVAHGHVTVPGSDGSQVVVRDGQVLVTDDRRQTIALDLLTAHCDGPTENTAADDRPVCMLDDYAARRFRVYDKGKIPPPSRTEADDRGDGGLGTGGKLVLGAIVIAVPLTIGVVKCDGDACKALFGVPLGLDGLVLLYAALTLGSPHK